MRTVTIYSTPTCGYCTVAKEYFANHNVEYTEINVAEKPEAAETIMQKTGQMGVPVIVIDTDGKEEVLVGFDEGRLAAALGI